MPSRLHESDAQSRLQVAGPNALVQPRRKSAAARILGQLQSPLLLILLAAASISVLIGDLGDAIVIAAVVTLNAVLAAFQEGRADRSLRALRRMATPGARVVRGGRERIAPVADLVPGDVLVLSAGDAIVADARLFETAALQCAEAALTGESVPVPKGVEPVAAEANLAGRTSVVHAGTHVTSGRGRAVVFATGGSTEIGRIAALVDRAPEPRTPLEQRVDRFGKQLSAVAVALLAVVVGVGLARDVPLLQIALIGMSQMVGMVPESLPVAMSIALAAGMQRMARRKAIVRRLAAVETLGSATVVCTDKTGTLTRNEMTVVAIWLPDGRLVRLEGGGYSAEGSFLEGGRSLEAASDAALRDLLTAAVLCSDADVAERGGSWEPIGDPTEAALVAAAAKAGIRARYARGAAPRTGELPFDPAEKRMATEHRSSSGRFVLVKGALEAVLPLCAKGPADGAGSHPAVAAAEALASQGLRVLAVARADGASLEQGIGALTGRFALLGLAGEEDPPRPHARGAVEAAQQAGVLPVMLTGDHARTGLAIARAVGIAGEDATAIDGDALERLSDSDLQRRLDGARVFARVLPSHKLRIVEAFQRRGEVVAMTGDGVNDAPALVAADVGVAMGSGTEVAKQAADVVLVDDEFATIVAAIEEGRVVFANIRKTALLLLSTSAAEVAVLVVAMALGYPPPFAAVQILWNNLVTEGLVALNLVMDRPQGDELRSPPLPPGESLLPRAALGRAALMTATIAASTLVWFAGRIAAGVPFAVAQTEAFTMLAVAEWFNALNCRSERRSVFGARAFSNPWFLGGLLVANALQAAVVFVPALNGAFHTSPISLPAVLGIGAVSSSVLWVEELRKLIARRSDRLHGAGA